MNPASILTRDIPQYQQIGRSRAARGRGALEEGVVLSLFLRNLASDINPLGALSGAKLVSFMGPGDRATKTGRIDPAAILHPDRHASPAGDLSLKSTALI